ncbi:MAG: glycosyltransferase family 2 protein [Chthoniobacterales bacterium]
MNTSRIAIIIPACNEEACIGRVLEELLTVIEREKFVVAVGVNNSSDRTAEIARQYPVVVAETARRGYGHGCQAAINALEEAFPEVSAYCFMAADGASDPSDLAPLVAAYEQGFAMVLGARTGRRSNWRTMTLPNVLANYVLGSWCGVLTGRWFADLGPLRIIQRRLFDALALQEMTFGWTIEAQVGAALRNVAIIEVPAHERERLAGEQKVSGVTWRRSFSIGCRILAAGWRTRRRYARGLPATTHEPAPELMPQSQPGA